ncbi:YadA C-terminal domain-containing protein [Enterobacter asburiae]|uniref:YadA C-terminal domain-containing protein n=1 Tax=Scandinavium sp. UTDF21-P1B TaxID=3446379 RepID=UPI0034897B69
MTPATKPQAATSTDGEGEALTRANQERTAQQTKALQDAYRQRFAQLKGEALTRANQERTAQQTEALQDAYRTSAKKFNDEKGQALLEGNLKRTQIQSDALNAAKSEHEANQHQVDAAQYRTMVNAQVAESSHEEFVQQTDANTADINTLNTGLKQAQVMGSDAQSRANDAYANTEANRQALQATNHRVADNSAAIANHEQRIEKLEASNSANFGKLKNQVDENRQRASAAISGVAAMANIPQVIQGQTFSVGAGVGTTDSESALAVGFSARAAEHVVVKASVSDDTQQNFVVGGGVSYGW